MNSAAVTEAVRDWLLDGGWVMAPLFLVGWIAWGLVVHRWWTLHRIGLAPVRIWQALDKEGEAGLHRLISCRQGPVSSAAAGVLQTADAGDEIHQRILEEVLAEWRPAVRGGLRPLSRLVAVAPLLGLLGTVSGMVHTFATITQFGFGNPVLLADGIAEALVTTEGGLIVAFPLLLAHNYLQGRSMRMEADTRAVALSLSGHLRRQP